MRNLMLYVFFGTLYLSIFLTIDKNIFEISVNNYFLIILGFYFLICIFGLFYFSKKSEFYDWSKMSIIFIISLLIGCLYYSHEIIEHSNEINSQLRAYGKLSFLYLSLCLLISPIINIFKIKKFYNDFFLVRKIFGILSFLFLLKHFQIYILDEYKYFELYGENGSIFINYFIKNILNRMDVLIGTIGLFFMIFLGITSNKISVSFLGKFWKMLHIFIYPIFLIVALHIAFAGRFDLFYGLFISIVVTLRSIDYLYFSSNNFGITQENGNLNGFKKYICVPCGYIYDEKFGDIDGGIQPGTKFEDIINTRQCPICGASKKDFILIGNSSNEDNQQGIYGKIYSKNIIGENILELSIIFNEKINYISGQYIKFELKDFDGIFHRNYSIAKNENNNILTFYIRLKIDGRGSKLLKNIQLGEKIIANGIYGDFILKNKSINKVFIATGTGISPIYSMINDIKNDSNKNISLFYGVGKKQDILLENEFKQNNFKEFQIFISDENIKGYNFGRIKIDFNKFSKDSEFYLCGNPEMVISIKDELTKSGFKNIYFEKFL